MVSLYLIILSADFKPRFLRPWQELDRKPLWISDWLVMLKFNQEMDGSKVVFVVLDQVSPMTLLAKLLMSLVPLNCWTTHVFNPFAPMLLMQAKFIHCGWAIGVVALVVLEVVFEVVLVVVLTKAH